MIKGRQRTFRAPASFPGAGTFPGTKKSILPRRIMIVVVTKERDEIKQIGGIESPVAKAQELPEVFLFVLHDELKRRTVHQLHEFLRLPDNGRPVAPGE